MIALLQQQAPSGDPSETTTYVEETFRFLNLPPLWVLALVVLPGSVAFAWWSYSGLRRLETPTRATLSALRWLAVALCCLLLFQPAFEITTYRKTRNQVHVLVDDSASMARQDRYPAEDQRRSLEQWVEGDLGERSRAALVQEVLEREQSLREELALLLEERDGAAAGSSQSASPQRYTAGQLQAQQRQQAQQQRASEP